MRRPTLENVAAGATLAATVLLVVQLVDVLTHGSVRARVAAWARTGRDRLTPPPRVPSPADVTALLSEAVRVTREAAKES